MLLLTDESYGCGLPVDVSVVVSSLFTLCQPSPCGTLSAWGSSNYRPSAPFLYEVASHVKNCHFGDYYYYYYYVCLSAERATGLRADGLPRHSSRRTRVSERGSVGSGNLLIIISRKQQ